METQVFKKTSQGHEEISSRRCGLTASQRRLLLFVDGKRRLAEAIAMASCNNPSDAERLFAGGFIEEVIIPTEEPPKQAPTEHHGQHYFIGDN